MRAVMRHQANGTLVAVPHGDEDRRRLLAERKAKTKREHAEAEAKATTAAEARRREVLEADKTKLAAACGQIGAELAGGASYVGPKDTALRAAPDAAAVETLETGARVGTECATKSWAVVMRVGRTKEEHGVEIPGEAVVGFVLGKDLEAPAAHAARMLTTAKDARRHERFGDAKRALEGLVEGELTAALVAEMEKEKAAIAKAEERARALEAQREERRTKERNKARVQELLVAARKEYGSYLRTQDDASFGRAAELAEELVSLDAGRTQLSSGGPTATGIVCLARWAKELQQCINGCGLASVCDGACAARLVTTEGTCPKSCMGRYIAPAFCNH
jgi:hypothetical protein